MKSKGDQAEREALQALVGLSPPALLVPEPTRRYGAGQMFDKGDLDVFPDVTVQVKWVAKLADGVRQALDGAVVQQRHAKSEFHLGLARTTGSQPERWVAVCSAWPTGDPEPHLGTHARVTKATAALLSCSQEVDRVHRIAAATISGRPTFWVCTVEAWIDALARHRGVR